MVSDPLALVSLYAIGLIYARGVRRVWAAAGRGRVVHRWEAVSFGLGLAATALALASPLDDAAATNLTAHMVQHVILMTAAPLLLALGGLGPALLWAPPERRHDLGRRALRRLVRSQAGDRWLAWVVAALVAQASVMWAWHAPALYEAALHSSLIHGAEHVSFLATSMLFWWTVAASRRSRRGWAVVVLFVGGLPATALGAALLLAPHPWYPTYASAASSLDAAMVDQQLAGVVMWSGAGLVNVIAAAALFGTWLAALPDRRLAPSFGGAAR